jgi:predicted Ser/Thr protein kinase
MAADDVEASSHCRPIQPARVLARLAEPLGSAGRAAGCAIITAVSDPADDLGHTATAAASATPGPADPVGATLGRYRLERELGSGAMGVVHAAFDPDLERRIALKVLRVVAPTTEAKDRLMREARAMARLSHANVVTVHEVGTAGGRDYVAMELIHGEPLAEWLRSSRRRPEAIIDAFVAAGRGLAAAHAAGIVHRDFKPHNVLRSREGRIVVTDFGLAREAEGALPVAIDATLPVGTHASTATSTPSSLAGLTMTGALLGTPAYMAPEQWSGGAVTPATDQFAYCVALWEALGGERPYRGPTFEDLRAQVARGPAALDASKLPRRVRGILRRGLDPAPGQRWPSMDALLAQLVRAQRRPGVALAIAGAAVVAAAVLIVAMRGGDTPVAACEPPARDVTTVWSPAIAADLRVKASEAHAAVLDAAFRDWQAARAKACTAPPQVKQVQLQCLDGALGRFDALRQAYARVPGAAAEGIQAQLIDPEICRKPVAADVPRLTLAPTPDVLAAYELSARSETDDKPSDAELAALGEKPNVDPCARVIATLAFDATSKDTPRARSLSSDAVSAVDQCGDERLRADLLIQEISYQREVPVIGPKGEAAIKQAQVAARRVMQPDVEAALAAKIIDVARQREGGGEAFRLVETEIAGYGARGLHVRQVRAVITRNNLRLGRAEPGDLDAIIADARTWRSIAAAARKPDLAASLDDQAAAARFWLGDVAGGHAELLRLWRARPHTERASGTREVHGEVVDERGRPVAGASVAVASLLGATSFGIGWPAFDFDGSLQITTTDDAGRFAITGPVQLGAIAAQLADRRSKPSAIADQVRLVLAPTRSVSGKVDLKGMAHTRLAVACLEVGDPTGRFHMVAPVAADGSFAIAGVTLGAVRVGVLVKSSEAMGAQIEFQLRPASPAPITDLQLSLASSTRIVDVVVRSAVASALEGAQVVVVSGKPQIRNVGDLVRLQTSGVQARLAKPVVREQAPRPVLDKLRSGDLVAHVEHVALGEITVCAFAFTGDLLDPQVQKRMQDHVSELALRCEQIGPDTAVVVVSVPPQQRFD